MSQRRGVPVVHGLADNRVAQPPGQHVHCDPRAGGGFERFDIGPVPVPDIDEPVVQSKCCLSESFRADDMAAYMSELTVNVSVVGHEQDWTVDRVEPMGRPSSRVASGRPDVD
ncbi:MAG: hypothetical protein R2849_20560 [Thermomicrobiales bacterium]